MKICTNPRQYVKKMTVDEDWSELSEIAMKDSRTTSDVDKDGDLHVHSKLWIKTNRFAHETVKSIARELIPIDL